MEKKGGGNNLPESVLQKYKAGKVEQTPKHGIYPIHPGVADQVIWVGRAIRNTRHLPATGTFRERTGGGIVINETHLSEVKERIIGRGERDMMRSTASG